MSKTSSNATWSYVIGFILSLICTVIPYSLVVNKTVTGNHLLATIIGFAFIQMLIQIFFFLHLGRGPKPFYNIIFFVATVTLIVVVVGGSLFIMKHLHYNMTPTQASKQLAESEGIYQVEGTETGACEAIKDNHKITITSTGFIPSRVDADLCDTLSFVNETSSAQEVHFGTTSKQQSYAGEPEISVKKGKSETITLNESGTYQFYNHDKSDQAGSFTVKP